MTPPLLTHLQALKSLLAPTHGSPLDATLQAALDEATKILGASPESGTPEEPAPPYFLTLAPPATTVRLSVKEPEPTPDEREEPNQLTVDQVRILYCVHTRVTRSVAQIRNELVGAQLTYNEILDALTKLTRLGLIATIRDRYLRVNPNQLVQEPPPPETDTPPSAREALAALTRIAGVNLDLQRAYDRAVQYLRETDDAP